MVEIKLNDKGKKKKFLDILANSELLLMTQDTLFPETMRAYFFEPNNQAYLARIEGGDFELMPTDYLTIIPIDPDRVIGYKYTSIQRLPKCLDEQYYYALGHLECDVTGTVMFLEGKGEYTGAIARIFLPRFGEDIRKMVESAESESLKENIKRGWGEGFEVDFSSHDYISALSEPYREECMDFQRKRAERLGL